MTTMSCFSSSLPCTKRPRQSSFMLAFGWKVLSTLDTRPPHPTLLSLLAPLLKGRNISRRPAWCWKWLGLHLLSFCSWTVLSRFCFVLQNRVFWSPYIYAKSFFFTSTRALVIWWHFSRRKKKKHKSKNTTKIKLDALPLMDLSQIYKLIFYKFHRLFAKVSSRTWVVWPSLIIFAFPVFFQLASSLLCCKVYDRMYFIF